MLPALSEQVPEADWPLPSVFRRTGASQKSTPDNPSDPLKLTVTAELFQPLNIRLRQCFGTGDWGGRVDVNAHLVCHKPYFR